MKQIFKGRECEHNGLFLCIPQLENETQEHFNLRINLIFNQNIKNHQDFNEVLKLSSCWYNYEFLRCSYHQELTNKILKFNKGIQI